MFSFFHKNRIRNSFGQKLRRWIFEKRTKCEKLNVKTSKSNTNLHINDCIKIFSEYVSSLMTTIGETPWYHSSKITTDTLVSKTQANKFEQTTFQLVKMMQKKNGTIVARWKQLTICWPQSVGAYVSKNSINQTTWLNCTFTQLAYTEIRIDNAHNAFILHFRDVGRTSLPLLTLPLPYLTLLSSTAQGHA